MLPLLPPKGRLDPLHYFKNLKYLIPPSQIAFSGLECAYWAAMAGTSMTAVYLQSRGLSADEVGELSAFFALVGIFAPPIWGMVSDKLRSAKRVFMLCIAVSAVFWLASPFVFDSFSIAWVWLLFPLARFFFGPTNALLDSWLVRTVHADRRLSYGQIRMFGSVGFAVMSIAYTFLMQNVSMNVVFYGYALMVVAVVLLARKVQDDTQSARALKFREMKIGRLLKSFPFITFLLFNVALYMPVNASLTFLPYLIDSIGQDSALIGAIVGIKALLEIPLLLLSGRLIKRFRLPTLMIAAALGYALEMFLYPFCTNIYAILAVQCMHGAIFGLYLSAQIQYVHQLAPEGLVATAQTLAGAATAFSGILGNLVGGFLISGVGLHTFYIASGAVQAAAAVLFMLSLRHKPRTST